MFAMLASQHTSSAADKQQDLMGRMNDVMKSLAATQRRAEGAGWIAVVIAVLTLLFLPLTFMAVRRTSHTKKTLANHRL